MSETCNRCSDKLSDIADIDFHNACHDYMERHTNECNDANDRSATEVCICRKPHKVQANG